MSSRAGGGCRHDGHVLPRSAVRVETGARSSRNWLASTRLLPDGDESWGLASNRASQNETLLYKARFHWLYLRWKVAALTLIIVFII